ncbi:hypothetical protein MLD38_008818 [Melastoma candidum]|uniref:Uncharacterized protein n=1 Tax=Melastoma candidum TaxID=119954 RepID=A0ACB9RZA5_9MYRT|nr:hypothetical protein MLD38_008818 [Melastoma candidum]
MGKIWVEVGLISARGLRRFSILKLQWFAVGWIDPRNKYCSRVDASGGTNPTWNTKFAALVDASDKDLQEMELHVEVYGREPVFLTERLQGRVTVVLKEFLDKHHLGSDESSRRGVAQTASYQLRKPSSNKPQGFVDISVRITEEGDDPRSYRPGNGEIELTDHDGDITLSTTHASPTQHLPIVRRRQREISADTTTAGSPRQHLPFAQEDGENHSQKPTQESQQNHPPPSSRAYYYPPAPAQETSHGEPRGPPPPPPPPPSNVGLVSTFLPIANAPSLHQTRGGRDSSPDFATGMGAGALAAGAVIFGDDFLSGFDVPRRLQDDSHRSTFVD